MNLGELMSKNKREKCFKWILAITKSEIDKSQEVVLEMLKDDVTKEEIILTFVGCLGVLSVGVHDLEGKLVKFATTIKQSTEEFKNGPA